MHAGQCTRLMLAQGLMGSESLGRIPFLILANKVDIKFAASEDQLKYALAVDLTGKVELKIPKAHRAVQETKDLHGQRAIELFPCSVVKRFGYAQGMST